MKKLIAFDLDGTLTESKTDIDMEMVGLLEKLQKIKKVAVIGGASFKQFEKQFLNHLNYFANLYILPTSGASFFKYEADTWTLVYQLKLTTEEKAKIFEAFDQTFKEIDYHHPSRTYGPVMEIRDECEVAFSILGQQAPLAERLALKYDRRLEIIKSLQPKLPEFKISLAGVNTIDVTRQGIDKGYAIEQISKIFNVNIDEMVFVGDAIYEGKNDYAVVRTGIETVKVSGPLETKRFIQSFLVLS